MSEKISLDLIKKAQDNDIKAQEEILKTCEYIAIAEANKINNIDATEKEDLKQIARYSIFTSIFRYDGSYGASFETFATICAHNRILDHVKTIHPTEPLPEGPIPELPPTPPDDPLYVVLQKLFTPEEFNILILWTCNYSYDEIVKDLNVKRTKIANTITKLKKLKDKIRKEAGI